MKKTKVKNKSYKIKIDYIRLIFSVISIYFVISFCMQQVQLNNYENQKEIYNKGIMEQKQKLKKYEEEKNMEKTDELMEKYARDLGYVKPYEKIFIDINK